MYACSWLNLYNGRLQLKHCLKVSYVHTQLRFFSLHIKTKVGCATGLELWFAWANKFFEKNKLAWVLSMRSSSYTFTSVSCIIHALDVFIYISGNGTHARNSYDTILYVCAIRQVHGHVWTVEARKIWWVLDDGVSLPFGQRSVWVSGLGWRAIVIRRK